MVFKWLFGIELQKCIQIHFANSEATIAHVTVPIMMHLDVLEKAPPPQFGGSLLQIHGGRHYGCWLNYENMKKLYYSLQKKLHFM